MAESTDTCIYTDVFVRGVNIIRLGVMDRRLVPGTIVTLSPVLDNFQTRCVVAVVTAATTGRYNELIDWPMTPPPLDLEVPNAKITAGLMEPDQEVSHRTGTSRAGKTHKSMPVLKILLNMQPSNVSVIVTGRKNNSVDKLLIRCIKLDVDFVRLGGQAKGEAVTGRTLSNLRMQYQGKKWLNAFKAAMIIGLYEYLVLNGSVPPDITIPTFYSGQKSCIESSLRRKYGIACCYTRNRESILGPEVQTMDGCQGKEKDLILVSITRSPEDRSKPDAGFLKDLRRVIVALSRPCRLLVVLDDTQVLLASSARSSWSKVLDRMKGPPKGYILVFCEAHGREIRK
ncbi:helicase required for rnai-mediated heterochromatin assembly 1 [Colletotrichum incanum]|uniref:Helicase required for rnai-mediated heterochromatin assembly 1 n=1 Tax=Colletotrichum incanum TaxID=1573173 RepID=A0A161W8Z9_COLIC|nr:helicase required for rnai-mediated heterochromatin assembly 1 [Colletotrichum incanum]